MNDKAGEISLRRCYIHASREAAVRCPECGRYFCRECATEHEERMLCASCLRKATKQSFVRRFRFAVAARVLQSIMGLGILWMAFYYIGQGLLSLPDSFHEGTIWEKIAGRNDR